MGFALIRRDVLEQCKGNAHSLSLDLFAQWQGFEKNGQWRFTPPTQVIAAFSQALDEHAEEGGVAGRGARLCSKPPGSGGRHGGAGIPLLAAKGGACSTAI